MMNDNTSYKDKIQEFANYKPDIFIWYVSFSCATMISNLDGMNSTNKFNKLSFEPRITQKIDSVKILDLY